MEIKISIALTLAGLAISSPGLPQSSDVNSMQCFIVANVFAKAGNEKERPVAERAKIYFLGRLPGTTEQVRADLAKQLNTINNQNNGPIMSWCVRAMNKRIQEVQAAQQALAQQRAKDK